MTESALTMENVQDYPRPPLVEPAPYRITARAGGALILDTEEALRICETHHPPTYYFPLGALHCDLIPAAGRSFCEWKGQASYWSLKIGETVLPQCTWSYKSPTRTYAAIRDFVAIYPNVLDEAHVAGLAVVPQPGDFYGGWVTENLTGTVKGGPGTMGW
ncbi:MAG: DUF427 domain-containing protein [Pseudomonadota bacterium]